MRKLWLILLAFNILVGSAFGLLAPGWHWSLPCVVVIALGSALFASSVDWFLKITDKAMAFRKSANNAEAEIRLLNLRLDGERAEVNRLSVVLIEERDKHKAQRERLAEILRRTENEAEYLRLQLEAARRHGDEGWSKYNGLVIEMEATKVLQAEQTYEHNKELLARLGGIIKEAQLVRIRGELIANHLLQINEGFLEATRPVDEEHERQRVEALEAAEAEAGEMNHGSSQSWHVGY